MSKLFNSLQDVKYYKNDNNIIGSGGFSVVSLVYHISNPKKLYAMKKVAKKDEKELFYIKQEITLHQKLDHSNIIKFYEYFEDQKFFYFFLEYAEKGDLFEYIKDKKPNKNLLKKFFYQTCLAIEYIHNLNVMHRDLKPENILINSNLEAKLCDFGWAATFKENERRESLCGTYEYMAYEVFSGDRQTKKTDIWALGVLLYEFYHSYAPFRGKGIADILFKLKNVDKFLVFDKECDEDVKHLVKMILKKDCEKRPKIKEILEHRFFDEFRNPNFVEKKIKLGNRELKNMNFSKKKKEQIIIFNTEEVKYLIKTEDFNNLKNKNIRENHSSTRGSINDEKRDSGLRNQNRIQNKHEIKSQNFTNIYEKKKIEKEKNNNNFQDFLQNYGENSNKVKKYRYSYQKGNIVKNFVKENLNYSESKVLNHKNLNIQKKSNFSNYISKNRKNFEKVEKKNYKHSLSIEPKKKIRLTFDSKLNQQNSFSINSEKKIYSLSIKSERNHEFISLLTKKKGEKKCLKFFTKFNKIKNNEKLDQKKIDFKNQTLEILNKNDRIDLMRENLDLKNKKEINQLKKENSILNNFDIRKIEKNNIKKKKKFIYKPENVKEENIYSVRSGKNYFLPEKNYQTSYTEIDEDRSILNSSSVKNGDKFKNRRNGLNGEISKKLRFSVRNNDKFKHNKKLKEFFNVNTEKKNENIFQDGLIKNIEGIKKDLLFNKFEKKYKNKKKLKKNIINSAKTSNSPILKGLRKKVKFEKKPKLKGKKILELLKQKSFSKINLKKNLSNNAKKENSKKKNKKKKKNLVKINNQYTPNIKNRNSSKLHFFSKIKKNKIINTSRTNSLIEDMNLNILENNSIYKKKKIENKKNNKFTFKNFQNVDLENIYSKNNNLKKRKNFSLVNNSSKKRSRSIRINLDHSKDKIKEIMNKKKHYE